MILKLCLTLFLWVWAIPGQAEGLLSETPEAGVGPWQEMPFGKMRVLSCTSGVKDLGMAVGGVQVQLKPDWTMKKPQLEPLSTAFPSWMETPVVMGEEGAPVYRGEFVLPIVAVRNPKEKADFIFGMRGNFPVCHGQKCMTFPIQLTLPLSADSADYTSVCAYLMAQQRHVPLPGDLFGVKGKAWQQGGAVHFAFTGIKGAQIAFLQASDQHSFQTTETRLEEERITMRVETVPWAKGETQEWVLISNRGIFKVPVEMGDEPMVFPPASVSWKIWLLGWELFFLTPLFIWWGLGIRSTQKAWRRAVMHFVWGFPVVLIAKAVLSRFVSLDMTFYAIGIWGLVCLFPPKKSLSALALFLVWPYFPKVPSLPISLFVVWLIVMWIEVMLPFVFLYFRVGEVSKILGDMHKKHFFTYNLIFLLPTVMLLGVAVWQNMHARPIYANELNPEGLTVVCEKCFPWQEMGATFISPKTPFGRSLQRIYKRSEVVIWQENGKRVILPPGITPKQGITFMEDWQTYHASDTP